MRFMFLIVPNMIFLNHVFIYLFIISRLDLLFYFFFHCYYYYYYYYLWNYLLLILHVNEGNEWPKCSVFGPSDPSPKAFTDPPKTRSKTSESTPT